MIFLQPLGLGPSGLGKALTLTLTLKLFMSILIALIKGCALGLLQRPLLKDVSNGGVTIPRDGMCSHRIITTTCQSVSRRPQSCFERGLGVSWSNSEAILGTVPPPVEFCKEGRNQEG